MTASLPFRHLISLEPLGLLYGASGRYLSAENLTGAAGEHFPPDSPAFAGLIAAHLPDAAVRDLITAGPFWCRPAAADLDLHLPAPFTLLQESGSPTRCVKAQLSWQNTPGCRGWQCSSEVPAKPEQGGWVPLRLWGDWSSADLRVQTGPWKPVPHLHPRLRDDERVSVMEDALFLEYAIAIEPGVALAYLSSEGIEPGCYRFGGEGHLVQLRCHPVPQRLQQLLNPADGFGPDRPLALITPGVWGSRKLSLREPLDDSRQPAVHPWHSQQLAPGILTERPRPWRFRLGAGRDGKGRRRLSRGRWCVPAGTCYALPPGLQIPPWADWPVSWFPGEGNLRLRHFGTALPLPLLL
jgi:CRISPR-associated protein Cmr3